MPAMVSTMYAVKIPSWHRQEVLLDGAPQSVKDSLAAAGQDWTVEVEPIYQKQMLENGDHKYSEVCLGKMTRRSDTGEPLSIIGPHTKVLQNHQAFGFLQQYLDAKQITLETAGCLDEGRKVWTLARINRPEVEVTKGDYIRKYLLISNSHDNTMAVKVGFTPVRVVCWNTLSAAVFGKDANKCIESIRHSSQVVKKVENVVAKIDLINEKFDKGCEGFKALTTRNIKSTEELKAYFAAAFEMKPKKDSDKLPNQSLVTLETLTNYYDANLAATSELLKSYEKRQETEAVASQVAGAVTLEQLCENFEAGAGADNTASRGTYWNAYNAITQYLTHDRGRTDESRLASLWAGNSAIVSTRALNLAYEMSGLKSA